MHAIGVDVGGTKIAAGVISAEGEILSEVRYPTANVREPLLSAIAEAIEGILLKEELGGRTGLQVTVENDANAAAWGEFRFGAGRDVEDLILVTLGTGVGGGVISRGVLLRGARGMGGSWGMSPYGRPDLAVGAATVDASRL